MFGWGWKSKEIKKLFCLLEKKKKKKERRQKIEFFFCFFFFEGNRKQSWYKILSYSLILFKNIYIFYKLRKKYYCQNKKEKRKSKNESTHIVLRGRGGDRWVISNKPLSSPFSLQFGRLNFDKPRRKHPSPKISLFSPLFSILTYHPNQTLPKSLTQEIVWINGR